MYLWYDVVIGGYCRFVLLDGWVGVSVSSRLTIVWRQAVPKLGDHMTGHVTSLSGDKHCLWSVVHVIHTLIAVFSLLYIIHYLAWEYLPFARSATNALQYVIMNRNASGNAVVNNPLPILVLHYTTLAISSVNLVD